MGGYTEPRGARAGFGALLLGLPAANGRLRYAGHVGGGFSDKELARSGASSKARGNILLAVRRAAARQRKAALGPSGAGRRGEIRRVDLGGLPAAAGLSRVAGRSVVPARARTSW